MKLVIVEKEKLAITMAAALGHFTTSIVRAGNSSVKVYNVDNYTILSLSGHITNYTTPARLSKWTDESITDILTDPKALVKEVKAPAYVAAIRQLASAASEIVISCDADSEGENIGLEVVDILRANHVSKPISRLWLTTTVPSDIRAAFSKLRKFDENMALSVEARRKLDAATGFAGTRILTLNYKSLFGDSVISFGRVQTATLRILVERENAIKGFASKKYWAVEAKVLNTIFHSAGKSFENKVKAQTLYDSVKGAKEFTCKGVVSKTSQMLPPTPMNTTALLKAGSGVLRYTPNEVLNIAEALYLDAAITYPRVDNQAYSPAFDHTANLQKLKSSNLSASIDYIMSKRTVLGKPQFTNGKANPDHEPLTPIAGLTSYKDARAMAVYDLVLRHYLSIFYPPAKFADIDIGGQISGQSFEADGRRLAEKGFYEVFYYQPKLRAIDDFIQGQVYPVEWVKLVEKTTDPPSRFTESSLIAEMERAGIGTKATRPSIIETIKNRNYVTRSPGGVLTPSDRGMKLIGLLAKAWPEYTSTEFTSRIEKEMEKVAQGQAKWTDVVDKERNTFLAAVNTLRSGKSNP
ncbi:MAG: type IA DNA topoisomerase [Nitrososphaerota archaeon]|nr:type IA DNA topoisomerase [Nitrososphaerota archaeon]